jgi:DNA invertase Pin-like site-specific DNA recombinase
VEAVPDAWRGGTGVSPTEVLAMLAFRLLEGCSTSEIVRRFHRKRDTVSRYLRETGRSSAIVLLICGSGVG